MPRKEIPSEVQGFIVALLEDPRTSDGGPDQLAAKIEKQRKEDGLTLPEIVAAKNEMLKQYAQRIIAPGASLAERLQLEATGNRWREGFDIVINKLCNPAIARKAKLTGHQPLILHPTKPDRSNRPELASLGWENRALRLSRTK